MLILTIQRYKTKLEEGSVEMTEADYDAIVLLGAQLESAIEWDLSPFDNNRPFTPE